MKTELFLVHGWGGHARIWQPIREKLAHLFELLRTLDLRSAVASIALPVQVIGCSNDQVVRPDASRYLAGMIDGARLDMPDSAHVPFVSSSRDFVSCLLQPDGNALRTH